MFTNVEARPLLFFADSDTAAGLEGIENRQGGNEGKYAVGHDADELRYERVITNAEDADRERSPNSTDQVDRDGAHRVVKLCTIDLKHRDDDNYAGDETDDDRRHYADHISPCCDANQSRECTIEYH